MSKYAKRDYELAARMIRDTLTTFSEPAHKVMLAHIAGRYASTFQIDNTAFDMERFVNACGVREESNAQRDQDEA